jgi:integral membrane protein
MWTTPIDRLRLIGWIEGASFLLLLGVAMPIKYMLGEPIAVRIVGMIHGVLWLGFCAVLVDTKKQAGWTLGQALVPFVAALLPFGPFLIDRRLRETRSLTEG